ncbi:hypothetical protein [Rhodococcus sp. ACT016]|uniref:hypothetical protein n=1 Tax=Rhodococcus sp. ACT016 TaxID=3134808 RepID=UPI003D2CCC8A
MATTFRRAAVATTAVAGLALAGAGVAGAANVIPGDTDPGITIITSQPGVTVTIDSVDRATGAVSGTFVNNSGMNLNCTAPNPNPNLQRGGTVSTATVVRDSLDYYTQYQSDQAGTIAAGSTVLITKVGVTVPFWPLLQLVPTGSLAGSLSDGTAESAAIVNAHTDAKMHGLAGEVGTFTVNNGTTKAWNTTLSPAAIGERSTDELGAIFVCRVGTTANVPHYAWVGYESGEPPAPDTDSGSLTNGSLGSSQQAPGSAGLGSAGSSEE